MNAKGMHIRDQVILDQSLADSLATGPSGPRYVMAREIVFGITPVELTGRDVIFVADTIRRGGDAPFVVHARPLPPRVRVPGAPPPAPTGKPGRNGNPGQRVEIYCRQYDGVRIQSIGGTGEKGDQGLTGADAIAACERLSKTGTSGPRLVCEPPSPDPTGKRGGPGGSGGDAGPIAIHYCTKSSDGELQGLGGAGGPGGDGGVGGKILNKVAEEDGTVHTQDPHQRGKPGSPGVTGKTGNAVAAVLTAESEDSVWNKVKDLSGGAPALAWGQHRFKQGEYLFRSYRPTGPTAGNLGLATQEFRGVIEVWPGSHTEPEESLFDLTPLQLTDRAHKLRGFILDNQNVYGVSRNLYVIPYVDNELEDLAPYEALPLLFKQDLLTTLLKATDASTLSQYLQTQIDALAAATRPQGSLTLEEVAASEAASAANAAKTDLVARADQLRIKLESLRLPAQLEQQSQGDDGMIIPGVRNIKLFAIVASTILTIALPPAAAGTGALIATTLAPQLPDLLLGKGSQTEQDLEDLVKSGTALGQKLTPYLKDLEGTAAGLRQYADLYEASFKASGSADTALDELKKQLKKDFGSDAAAAKRFALDFKKLRADLVSVKAGPNSPKQTAFLEVARELASVAQQAQQAIFTARQAELARQVASARRDEAVDHGAALVTLKGTINQEGFALRKATEETLRRARKTVSLLASFQFRLVRALDLYTLAPFRGDARYAQGAESSLVRYDYAYVPPDRLADYAESKVKDLEPANTLLAALNSTFDLHEVTLNVREMRRNYRLEHGGRSGDIAESRVFGKDSAELAQFKATGRLLFRIPLDDIPFAYEAKVQNVAVILSNVSSPPNSPTVLNLAIARLGATEHKWHPDRHLTPPAVTQWLSPGPEFSGRDVLPVSQLGLDGAAARTFRGETRVNEDVDKHINLQCFGTGVAGDWEIRLMESADLARLAALDRLEFIVSYGAWLEASAPVVQSITYAADAVRPKTTLMATVTLAQPPKGEPATIALNSSEPNAVRLPASIAVPVGVRQAQFPMQLGEALEGAVIQVTAVGANRRSTEVLFPTKSVLVGAV